MLSPHVIDVLILSDILCDIPGGPKSYFKFPGFLSDFEQCVAWAQTGEAKHGEPSSLVKVFSRQTMGDVCFVLDLYLMGNVRLLVSKHGMPNHG